MHPVIWHLVDKMGFSCAIAFGAFKVSLAELKALVIRQRTQVVWISLLFGQALGTAHFGSQHANQGKLSGCFNLRVTCQNLLQQSRSRSWQAQHKDRCVRRVPVTVKKRGLAVLDHVVDLLGRALYRVGTKLPFDAIAISVGIESCIVLSPILQSFSYRKREMITIWSQLLSCLISRLHRCQFVIRKVEGFKVCETPISLSSGGVCGDSTLVSSYGFATFASVPE